jgi:hypothetical protein
LAEGAALDGDVDSRDARGDAVEDAEEAAAPPPRDGCRRLTKP